MTVVLDVAADGNHPVLRLRPWLITDMPDLLAATADEYPNNGLGSHPDLAYLFQHRWSGPRDAMEAGPWLSGQERGWERGDWLTFAVTDASQGKAVGHVGRGIAPAAVRAVTGWAFDHFGADRLPRHHAGPRCGQPCVVPGGGEERVSV